MTPLLQQTLLLAVVGLIAYSCRALNSFVWNTLSRLAFVSISVNSGDEVYYMLNRWLMERKQEEERKIQKKHGPTSFLRVLNKYRIVSQRAMQDDVPYHRDFDEASNDEDRWRVMWLPGFGTFSSDVEGVPLWVTMKNGKGRAGYALSSPKTTTITTYVWHMPKLKAFVDESIRAYRESSRGRITVYKTNSHGTLTRTKEYEPHELCKPDLPLLPKGVVEDVLDDVREFLQSGDFYKELGIPYRRGYLFHGSPGSGKTTLVKRMASEFHMDIVTVSLSSASMGGDEWLASVFSRAPGKSILLIEDIDVAFPNKGINLKRSKGGVQADPDTDQKADDEGAANGGLTGSGSGFTLSGLFNAIDGISAQESCVLVLTTNHPEKLDPALTRSGRIDVKVPFGPVCGAEAAAAYLRFFSTRFELARAFGDAVDQYNMRIAAAKRGAQQLENSDESESADTNCVRSASASVSPLNSAAVSFRVCLVDVSASDRPWTMSDVQEQLIRFRKNPERAASAPVSASASAYAA